VGDPDLAHVKRLAHRARKSQAKRDADYEALCEAIREAALGKHNRTYKELAEVSGLSLQRIHQIVGGKGRW
jgi:hypothetical protein